MFKGILFYLSVITILFTSCSKQDHEIENMYSTYPQLSGTFEREINASWGEGYYYSYDLEVWRFDQSKKATRTTCYYYWDGSNIINPNKISNTREFEWKIEDGIFYYKDWDLRKDIDSTWHIESYTEVDCNTIELGTRPLRDHSIKCITNRSRRNQLSNY